MTSRIRMACDNGLVNELKRTGAAISKKVFGYVPELRETESLS